MQKFSSVGGCVRKYSTLSASLLRPRMASDEIYDVIAKSISYGLHSPFNYHSFQSKTFFFPTLCAMCESSVCYPLLGHTISCIRCKIIAHRHCLRRMKKCSIQTFNKEIASDNDVQPSLMATASVIISNIGQQHQNDQGIIIQTALLNRSILPTTDNSLPAPGSYNCIWFHLLRQISVTNINRIKITLDFTISFTELTTSIENLLRDHNTIPGRAVVSLNTLYNDIIYSSHEEALIHANECCKTIFKACISQFTDEAMLGLTKENRYNIAMIVDHFMLSFNNRQMYKKIMVASTAISRESDEKIIKYLAGINDNDVLSINNAYNDIYNQLQPRVYQLVHNCLASGSKLKILVELLQDIATRKMDADTLLELLRYILIRDITTNKTLWLAEITYIENFTKDEELLLGAEGYTIVSFQQAYMSICN